VVNLDPTAWLFAGGELKRRKTATTKSQTPLPFIAGHHGRRRREEECSARRSRRETKEGGDTEVRRQRGKNSLRLGVLPIHREIVGRLFFTAVTNQLVTV
jgi:hypothetical protein